MSLSVLRLWVRVSSAFLILLPVFLLQGLCPAALRAQSAYFSGAQSVIGTGLRFPTGVAVDGSGNVYIADANNHRVLKVPPTDPTCATAGDCTNIGTGFTSPTGVAVDGSGNVYVVDQNNYLVLKVPPTDPTCATAGDCTTIGSGLSAPFGVAVDGSGNVYIADTSNHRVLKVPPTDSTCATAGDCTTIGGGLQDPGGVAIDSSGNVYIADYLNRSVLKVPPADPTCATAGDCTNIGSGLLLPYGVAVDGSGNVYIADVSNNRVLKVPPTDPTCATAGDCTTIDNGLNSPYGVAVDGSSNVYIADQNNSRVLKVQMAAVNFGPVAVNTSTPVTQTLIFTFTASGTIETPAVLTQGATGKDFTDTLTGTCTTNGTTHTYNAGDFCTVVVSFKPLLPGVRLGTAQLVSSSGAVIATANLYGTGLGPLVTFPGNTTVNPIGSGFGTPFGVAVDGSGDVFIADDANNAVKEVVAGTGGNAPGQVSSSSTVILVGSGFNGPFGVAVDGSGNVFVADRGNNAVKEIVAGTGGNAPGQVSSSSTVILVGSGFNQPFGVAVDGSGDVFVADRLNNAVKEIVAGTGGNAPGQVSSSSTVILVGSGSSYPFAVAVDGSGNVFVTYDLNNAVKEVVAGTGGNAPGQVSSSSTVILVGSGYSNPSGVAVDGSGDVFVADRTNNAVKEVVAGTGGNAPGQVSSSSTVILVGSGFSYPFCVAVDGSGNIIVTEDGVNVVKELPLSTPPALSFPNTAVGATSAAQTVTVANEGTAALDFIVPTSGLNPSVSANFSYNSGSTCPQLDTSSTQASLAPSASCTLALEFAPTAAGPLTGSATITDNNLNAAAPNYATQTISLSGTATGKTTPTVSVWPTASAITYGQTLASSTLTGGTASVAGTFTWTSPGTAPGAGHPSESVTFTPTDTTDYNTVTGTVNVTVNKAPLTVTAANATRAYGAANPTLTATVAGAVHGDTFTAAATTTATVSSPVGTYAITPTVTGANLADYTVNYVNGTLTVTKAALTLTVTANNATRVYGAANPTFTGTYTGAVNGDTFTVTATTTATASSPVGAYPITPTATGADLSDYTVNYVNGTLTVTKAPLTVTAANANRVYGAANPALTATVTGAVNGDTFTATATTTATTSSAVGTYAITPTVTGANINDYTVTAVNGTLTVSKATLSNITLSSTPNPSMYGQSVIFTATVPAGVTGTVNFMEGTTLLGTGTINGTTATFTTSTLTVGTYPVTAVYSGNADYSTATSGIDNQVVTAATVPDFTFTLTSAASQTVIPGQAASYAIQVAPTATTYPGVVNFTATGLPPGAAASFSPATVAANGGTTSSSVSIQTASQTAMGKVKNSGTPLVLAVLLLPFATFKRMRRIGRRYFFLCIVLLGSFAATTGLTGCGTGNGFFGKAPQTYNVTITATSGTIEHSVNVTLNVQ